MASPARLEREPKESILPSFEISVIERYFPEYPREIRRRVGGGGTSSGHRRRGDTVKSPLTAEQLEAFRAELEAELARLEQSMRVTDEGLKPVELDPGAVGRLSRIDELQNQALTRNLRGREEVKLGSLLQALRRIEEGTYGFCTECGEPIQTARLEVFPETATCRECTA